MKSVIKLMINYLHKTIISSIKKIISKRLKKQSTNQNKKLLIDCSRIYSTDMNTGIQRVVNNIIKHTDDYSQLHGLPIVTVAIEDGFITEVDLNQKKMNIIKSKFLLIRFLQKIRKKFFWYKLSLEKPVLVEENDILLMLDSSWDLNVWESVEKAKNQGATVIGVVYDLIPITHPQYCEETMVKIFSKYFDSTPQYFDGYIAISKTVMLDIESYLSTKEIDLSQYSFNYFKLGTDFKSTKYSIATIQSHLQNVYTNNQSVYLTVSTIEPRKNHQYLFDTFQELWKKDIDVALVIVGRIGWKTENLIQQIIQHPEYENRLFMFNDLDDNELNYCYNESKALLFPSYVEGFGLPIIESLQNGLPVLASDTPIHKEVGGDMIEYFDIQSTTSLVNMIQNIEKEGLYLKKPNSKDISISSWKESTKELLDKIISIENKATNNSKS